MQAIASIRTRHRKTTTTAPATAASLIEIGPGFRLPTRGPTPARQPTTHIPPLQANRHVEVTCQLFIERYDI